MDGASVENAGAFFDPAIRSKCFVAILSKTETSIAAKAAPTLFRYIKNQTGLSTAFFPRLDADFPFVQIT